MMAVPSTIATPAGAVSCKVGTQPMVVVFQQRRKVLHVGDRVFVREALPGSKWFSVLVESLEPLRVGR